MVVAADNLSKRKYSMPTLPEMNKDEFSQWLELFSQRIGVRASALRISYLVRVLEERMQDLGIKEYQQYFDYLHSGVAGEIEWTKLIDILTVHETRFFRHTISLEYVRSYTELRCRDSQNSPASIQAWSVGCATGEEAYSLAMIIDQAIESSRKEGYFGVVATDVSRGSLSVGRRGIYHQRKLTNLSEDLKSKYLTCTGDQRYQVCKKLRDRVCFAPVNVLDIGQNFMAKMDIVYCQNVLIYFEQETRMRVLTKLVDYILPGGILILGAGEIHGWVHPHLERIEDDDILAFRKISDSQCGYIQ